MNIIISDSWLREYLKTKATPKQIAEYLSLCSQSVEKLTKVNGDCLYEIEVTTNRPDCLSVIGIARELSVILPMFGIKANFTPLKLDQPPIPKTVLPIVIKNDSTLCRRVIALVLTGIKIGSSPDFIKKRLETSGIRSLSNIIDITNYVMLETGHPSHVFDYDRIKSKTLIIRRAKEGEKITTLDNKTFSLPGGDTVIDNGLGEIIDLPGIMGTKNSVVTEETKNILFFIENNDPSQIRKTSMKLGIRTMAATINEKGPNPELAMTAFLRGVELYQKIAGAKIGSRLIDLYPKPFKKEKVNLNIAQVEKVIGINIPSHKIIEILDSLGLHTNNHSSSTICCDIPSWRQGDIALPEDLIEEIARVFGYHNLPSILPPVTKRLEKYQGFVWIDQIKTALKYWGFTETATYSMLGEDALEKSGFTPQGCLKIANPLTSDLLYMQPSLIPSILKIIADNQASLPEIRIFEIANIYLPQGENDLPLETPMLTGCQNNRKFFEIKGIVEALLQDLGINDFMFRIALSPLKIFYPERTAEIVIKDTVVGLMGEIEPTIADSFGIKTPVAIFDLQINPLLELATKLKRYSPIPGYPPVIEDLAFVIREGLETAKILETIKSIDVLIAKVDLLDIYDKTQTFRITYQSLVKTLSNEEVEEIRKRIIRKIREKFNVELKQ